MTTQNRLYFNFSEKVKKEFLFLEELGFYAVEKLPTLVRYQKGNIEVDIYHGQRSYEIGAGITAFGTRFSMSEIIRATDPEKARQFRYAMMSHPDGVSPVLKELSTLLKQYGNRALKGDLQFFEKLKKQGKLWVENYALEVLAGQLKPKADEAFRQADYKTAASLYTRIRKSLGPVELKKMKYAEAHKKKI